jgi:hypothetical protein
MRMRLILMLMLLTLGTAAWTQIARERKVGYTEISGRHNQTSLRIDQGKVWVNGKAIPNEELPLSLKRIDPNIYYESNVAGVSEFTFNLGDYYYLVQDGKLSELQAAEGDLQAYDSKTATEAYYAQLKRESPNLFYGLSREGILLEQVRTLLMEYSLANGKQKDSIKEEIRLVLGQLYDINERNKELEIAELEDMIEAAKQEVQYRKAHKSEIIGHSLDNLLK